MIRQSHLSWCFSHMKNLFSPRWLSFTSCSLHAETASLLRVYCIPALGTCHRGLRWQLQYFITPPKSTYLRVRTCTVSYCTYGLYSSTVLCLWLRTWRETLDAGEKDSWSLSSIFLVALTMHLQYVQCSCAYFTASWSVPDRVSYSTCKT